MRAYHKELQRYQKELQKWDTALQTQEDYIHNLEELVDWDALEEETNEAEDFAEAQTPPDVLSWLFGVGMHATEKQAKKNKVKDDSVVWLEKLYALPTPHRKKS